MDKRAELTGAIVAAAQANNAVLALWESGSEAFGRTDAFSDIDLSAITAAGAVESVASALRAAAERVAPIMKEYRQLTYHGDSQFYWQFVGLSEFLFVDIDLVEERTAPERIDLTTHGSIRVHFDKRGCLALVEEDSHARRERLREVVRQIAAVEELQPLLVRKQLLRGNLLHAYGEYQRGMVRPLIELLRLKYCPARSSFQTTYIGWDLPSNIVARLEPLVMPRGIEDIRRNLPIVQAWTHELLREFEDGAGD